MSKQSSSPATAQPEKTVIPAEAGISNGRTFFSAQRLLELYDRVADAPDAVERLRKFVLDLAVRGKLVEQDPADEPAADLLKKIGLERTRLYKEGSIKKPKSLPDPADEPFEVPRTWIWTRLGMIAEYIQRGKSPKYAPEDGSLVVSQRCVQWSGLDLSVARKITFESLEKYEPIRFLRDGDLLWNSTGTGTIGRVIRLIKPLQELVCDSHVTVVRCLRVDSEYVRTWLRTDHVYGKIEQRAAGSTNQVELTAKMANEQLVPLPPLAEQKRIVAKVNELMALLDRLETTRTRRETTRNRLTTASLSRLTPAETTETDFPKYARFALENLDQLTSRPEQIKVLRQTILNLAVRGKLVEQDSTDEPATIMLERLRKQRVRLQKDNRIPCQKSPAPDPARYIQELPENWACISLGEVINFVTSGSRGWAKYYSDTGAKFIRAQNIRFGYITLDNLANVQPPPDSEGSRTQVFRGDLLVVITGAGVTNPAKLQSDIGEAYVSQHIGLVRPTDSELSDWLLLCLMADCGGRRELEDCAYGAGRPGLNLDNIRSLTIPLPPLAEQRRIVAKVGALMSLCDRLEAAVGNAETIRARLFHTSLHEALGDRSSTQEVT